MEYTTRSLVYHALLQAAAASKTYHGRDQGNGNGEDRARLLPLALMPLVASTHHRPFKT